MKRLNYSVFQTCRMIIFAMVAVLAWVPAQAQLSMDAKEETIDLGGGVKMEFVLIHPGSFVMGTLLGREKPARTITLTTPFYLGKFEITQKQWKTVMGSNPSYFKGSKLPVEMVSWDDCQSFLAKLQAKTGRQFALPTEAEWEYACRAGSTNAYGYGDDPEKLGDYAWYKDNSYDTPHPVGMKKPNAWGLYDMHGNVWELCADSYAKYPAGDVTDPKNPTSKRYYVLAVLRGGGWSRRAIYCRASYRSGVFPFGHDFDIGFRAVLLPQISQELTAQRTKTLSGSPQAVFNVRVTLPPTWQP